MGSCFGVEQLRRYAEPVSFFPDASFDDIACAEVTPDLANIDPFAFEALGRIVRDDE